jgi:hypothetical protein
LVLFVKGSDKQQLIEQVFTGMGSEHHLIEGLKLKSAEVVPD